MGNVNKVSGTLTANGNSTIGTLTTTNVRDSDGFSMHVSGDFGGGTVSLEFLSNAGAWTEMPGSLFSTDSHKIVTLPINTSLRINLSGATSPNVYYEFGSLGTSAFNT